MSKRNSSLIKHLDRYLGIPLIFLLGLLRPKQKLPANLKSVGLMKTASLGDTTLLTAIMQDLAPHCSIVFFCGDNALLSPHFPVPVTTVRLSVKNPIKALIKLRQHPVDILIDCDSWPRINALYTHFAKAKYRLGFKTSGQFRHYIFDEPIPYRKEIHALENYQTLIQAIGVTPFNLPKFHPYRNEPKDYLIFHLWAASEKPELRAWDFKYWKKLAEDNPDRTIYLTGSKDDFTGNEALLHCCNYPPNMINTAGKNSLQETMELLSNAACVISVNTGIMHIAAALGAPVVGISGPASSSHWGVVGKNINIRPKVTGCEYIFLGSEFKNQRTDCMQHIDYEEVREAVEKTCCKGPKRQLLQPRN